jgi:hypothetical protein
MAPAFGAVIATPERRDPTASAVARPVKKAPVRRAVIATPRKRRALRASASGEQHKMSARIEAARPRAGPACRTRPKKPSLVSTKNAEDRNKKEITHFLAQDDRPTVRAGLRGYNRRIYAYAGRPRHRWRSWSGSKARGRGCCMAKEPLGAREVLTGTSSGRPNTHTTYSERGHQCPRQSSLTAQPNAVCFEAAAATVIRSAHDAKPSQASPSASPNEPPHSAPVFRQRRDRLRFWLSAHDDRARLRRKPLGP